MTPHEVLEQALREAAAAIGAPADERAITLGPTRDPAHGDYATNVAMVLAKKLSRPPRVVAQQLLDALQLPAGVVRKVEIAGAGFINFFMEGTQLASVLPDILARGAEYGSSEGDSGERVDHGFEAFMATVGALLMGRRTYEVVKGFSGEWPYGDTPVLVATTKPLGEPAAPSVSAVSGTPKELLAKAREAAGDKVVYTDSTGAHDITSQLLQEFVVGGAISDLTKNGGERYQLTGRQELP